MITLGDETLGGLLSKVKVIYSQNTTPTEMSSIGGNMKFFRKFGKNTDVSTTEVSLWDMETAYPWSEFDSAIELFLSSSSANDTIAGTGAQVVSVEGCGDDGEFKYFQASMNGASNVSLGTGWKAVNRMFVMRVGSGGINAGLITCETGGGTVVSAIRAPEAQISYGQTKQSMFTVPANWVGFGLEVDFRYNTSSSRAGEVRIYARPGGATNAPFLNVDVWPAPDSGASHTEIPVYPFYLTGGTNIDVRALRTSGSGSSTFYTTMDILCVRKSYFDE